MPTAQNRYSKTLRDAKDAGKTIVCSMAPYVGMEVEHKPRHDYDNEPWILKGRTDSLFRYSGRYCHIQDEDADAPV